MATLGAEKLGKEGVGSEKPCDEEGMAGQKLGGSSSQQ
jgi:hypothetical protein